MFAEMSTGKTKFVFPPIPLMDFPANLVEWPSVNPQASFPTIKARIQVLILFTGRVNIKTDVHLSLNPFTPTVTF